MNVFGSKNDLGGWDQTKTMENTPLLVYSYPINDPMRGGNWVFCLYLSVCSDDWPGL